MDWNLEEAIAYYKKQGAPGDQSAVIALLREIQREQGGIAPYALETAAAQLGVKVTFLQAFVRRIHGLRMADVHCLELCAGPNCGKNRPLAEAAEALARASGGRIVLKYVPCMRMCGKGPNIRWDGKLHHGTTGELLQDLARER